MGSQLVNDKLVNDPPLEEWPKLPTETEIYIMPDGTVVVADLPLELQPLLDQLGIVAPGEILSNSK